MTTAHSILMTQQSELKKAHNAKFKQGEKEYRIVYEGGLSCAFCVYGREDRTKPYTLVATFAGYKLYSKSQVIAMAKNMVKKDSNRG